MTSTFRIEPTRLEVVSIELNDAVAELASAGATLGSRLHPDTAAALASLVRVMNCYYSNLMEGHRTRPRDIERALVGDLDTDAGRRDLQSESAAHVRLQTSIDEQAASGCLPEPASSAFIRQLHHAFYEKAPPSLRRVGKAETGYLMAPGLWRHEKRHDVAVGRHTPPSSDLIEAYMKRFEERYRLENDRPGTRLLVLPAAHHRFNYIHPFPDGNGRVSRLMSHAMAHSAGIGAHGLWSISRGLARGLDSRRDYRHRMDAADAPRAGDHDGRGNLSERALHDFSLWFLTVCIDQIDFMSGLFELTTLGRRLDRLVARDDTVKPEAAGLLREALVRGEFERGEASRISGLPERSARRLLGELTRRGLLASVTERGPVSLRFPTSTLESLFPTLYPET